MTDAIVTHDLTKTYGKSRGIRNVNLAVRQGEIYGFLGPNGAGKSTTLRTIMGLMKPTSGCAEVLGMDSHTQTREIHARTGNLPTEFALEDRMTGRQMIRLFGRLWGVNDLSYADELAERLDANLDRPMRKLSRGNKQKIGIVQAMFHQPDVIILDEPTGGLDPLVQETFLTILEEARNRGQTILFSSHVLAEIERVADRVGIIRDGEMVAVENPHELTGRAHRHVRVELGAMPDVDTIGMIGNVPGVEDLQADPDRPVLRFTVTRNMDEIVKLLARHPVVSLDVERPSLEEIFLTFYGPRENGGDE
ncbi:MAG TPA: ABC transporter ATP-binding protein [Thermomicrobiales bacterium]|nr:ABC transporter ATP-binding protein [Thermomicrobiales bacterium]